MQVYEYSGQLYLLTEDEGVISNIASFEKSDGFGGFTCKNQNKILLASTVALANTDKDMSFFALKALKLILKLEYTGAHSHLFQKHSIQIYTLNIPENEYVKKT